MKTKNKIKMIQSINYWKKLLDLEKYCPPKPLKMKKEYLNSIKILINNKIYIWLII